MNRLTHEELAGLRKRYPIGCRVKLIRMDDQYCWDLKPGMMGTVMHVDDIGTIHRRKPIMNNTNNTTPETRAEDIRHAYDHYPQGMVSITLNPIEVKINLHIRA